MSQLEAPMSFNSNYGSNNPMLPMTPKEVDVLRKRLFDNISDLNANKHRMHADEYHQLSNYHHYALTILDNIKIVRQAEMSDPYNRNMGTVTGNQMRTNMETINPYENKMDVVYKRNGQASFVDKNSSKFTAEWEKQFDANVNNPPMYTVPPSNRWGLPQ